MAVCSRCAGIYIGFLAGLMIIPLTRKSWWKKGPDRRVLIIAGTPMVLEFFLEQLSIWEGSLEIRFMTGFIAGMAVSLAALSAMVDLSNRHSIITNEVIYGTDE